MSEADRASRRPDPARSPPPSHFNFARDVVDRFATNLERPALLYLDARGRATRLGFGEMSDAIHRFASVLQRLGVAPGEPLLVLLPPIPAWQTSVIGAMAAGVLAIPTSISVLGPDDILHRARHSGAVAVVASHAHTEEIDRLAPQLPALRHRLLVREDPREPVASPPWIDLDEALAAGDPAHPIRDTRLEEPALVLYTSGTTGPAKAVLHDHGYAFAAARQATHWHGLREHDRFWPTTGWAKAAFVPWSCGTEIVVSRNRLAPVAQIEAIEALSPDVFCAPPTQYRAMVKEDLSRLRDCGLRECVAAGEPLNPEVIAAWQASTGLRIRDGYGQSEAGLLIANLVDDPPREGSMGRALPGITVDVIDSEGEPRAPGVEGDLAVHRSAPGLFREYWKDPAATRATRRGDWVLTGDRGRRDADGYFWFVGRADDVILSGSHRIGPFEVESRLLEHPDVVEAAAVGLPDAELGQVVKAWVVLRRGVVGDPTLEDALRRLFRDTERERRPAAFEFVEALPKTATGKILRRRLREHDGG